MFTILTLTAAHALDCAQSDTGAVATTCDAVEAAVLVANAEYGSEAFADDGPTRLQPERLLYRLETMVTRVEAAGCMVDPERVWGAGAYSAALTGQVGDTDGIRGPMTGTLTRATTGISGSWNGEALGTTVGRYDRNGRMVADIAEDGRFYAGYWVRVRGLQGVYVGLQGTCDELQVAEGLNGWFAGGLSDLIVEEPENTGPDAGAWSVSPALPVEGEDDLVCEATVAPSDDEGDVLSVSVSWTVDGVPWAGGTSTTTHAGDTVAASDLQAGEAWMCEGMVDDGELTDTASSASVTVQAGSIAGLTHTVSLPGGVDMAFKGIPAGTFEMGCKVGRDDVEGADCVNWLNGAGLHDVTLTQDFWMAETEVSQAQWAALAPRRAAPSFYSGAEHPVEQVSWHDAAWFANAMSASEGLEQCYSCSGGYASVDTADPTCDLVGSPYECTGYRLPTEAEWEYAARGGEDHRWAGSSEPLDIAWIYENNNPYGTKPVGLLGANGFGLHDMSGNVWEWTGDWFNDGPYSTDSVLDPEGALSGSGRVIRGGSWHSYSRYARVVNRSWVTPDGRGSALGFRLARPSL